MSNARSSEDQSRDGYSVAVSRSTFERMQDDPRINVTDHHDMGPTAEFDVFVAFGVRSGKSISGSGPGSMALGGGQI